MYTKIALIAFRLFPLFIIINNTLMRLLVTSSGGKFLEGELQDQRGVFVGCCLFAFQRDSDNVHSHERATVPQACQPGHCPPNWPVFTFFLVSIVPRMTLSCFFPTVIFPMPSPEPWTTLAGFLPESGNSNKPLTRE